MHCALLRARVAPSSIVPADPEVLLVICTLSTTELVICRLAPSRAIVLDLSPNPCTACSASVDKVLVPVFLSPQGALELQTWSVNEVLAISPAIGGQ